MHDRAGCFLKLCPKNGENGPKWVKNVGFGFIGKVSH